jgi:hypothetical protein
MHDFNMFCTVLYCGASSTGVLAVQVNLQKSHSTTSGPRCAFSHAVQYSAEQVAPFQDPCDRGSIPQAFIGARCVRVL